MGTNSNRKLKNEQEVTVSGNDKSEDKAERSNMLPRTNDIDKWQRVARNISLIEVGTIMAFLLILF